MKVDIDELFAAMERATDAFEIVQDLGEAIAETLAAGGQSELLDRLMAMRAQNDADRARRREKLAQAAGLQGEQ
ncbi:hypothetical protein JT366_09350 [Sphingomonas paucimobilis]|uniref:hypothetical protein n=1 Tax=Sphingomonas paucimobilis TaxID=13689 RepID=UPI001966467B|nr:hypothetical protein [Sphingomonas paucimobilis]QRY97105.1 hypothetical protein JT366_07675 [Sphingomonas paucimobilis]QRY97271.1 hypothetical protein JT366_08650 [Sphingomonas paucimobilis]QRY97399.1 hypothetical protein JT366_09350 [Sphingomonas paucimobilis]